MIEREFARIRREPYRVRWSWPLLVALFTPWHCGTEGCVR
jgi:hypothetical protein